MANAKLPHFGSLNDLTEFFDSHDMGNFELPEAGFEVDLQSRTFLVPVGADLMKRLADAARERHMPTEQLVQQWLEERVAHPA